MNISRRTFLGTTSAPFLVVLTGSGCGRRLPTGSGASEVTDWSPYIGVHTFSISENLQQPYIAPLIQRGIVRGFRIDMNSADAALFASWASEYGSDVLAIFPNDHLRAPGTWDVLSGLIARAPSVDHWEIGNEIDVFTDMTVDEYMGVFLELHARAEEEYPGRTIIAQAPCGGCDGAQLFEAMLDGGLLRLATEGRLPVVSLHYYSSGSPFLSRLKRQVQRLPPSTQVWVTETGIDQHERHLDWVSSEYPRLRSQLRASRIYWYVFAECGGFSLVDGLPGQCSIEPPRQSPLYRTLMGQGGTE